MLLKELDINPYNMGLIILISNNPFLDVPAVNLKYPGLNVKWTEDMAAWTNDHLYKGHTIFVGFDAAHFNADTAAHEAVHIVNLVFWHTGSKYDFTNQEPQAYLTGWVCGELHKAFEEFKTNKKNGTKKAKRS